MKKLLVALCACLFLLTGCSSSESKVASKGDIVKVNFVGKMNGEAFQGGSATGQLIELGAGKYIEGFEEGIVGMKLGETKDVNLTFPTNYYEDLAGKPVTFTITITDLYKEVK